MESDKISSYFKEEIRILTAVTISGLIYNIGLLAGPYFQGKLIDAVAQRKEMRQVFITAVLFITAITIVQTSRAIKRFAVRRFANDINAKMQNIIYTHIVNETEDHLLNENVGSLMTKAVSDVDVCVEGMRKFTTELFDTGIFLISYFITLLIYDWKLTALSCAFIPLALFIAGRLRKIITGYTASWRKSMSDITNSSFNLINNALLYRIYGREKDNYEKYQKQNAVYEKKAVLANIWENSMMPLYKCISLVGVIAIIAAGSEKVANGIWTIGKFTAYVTMFIALAEKASHAGKLFNAVQKAQVSWKRIKPFLAAGKINTVKTDIGFNGTNKNSAPVTNFPAVHSHGIMIYSVLPTFLLNYTVDRYLVSRDLLHAENQHLHNYFSVDGIILDHSNYRGLNYLHFLTMNGSVWYLIWGMNQVLYQQQYMITLHSVTTAILLRFFLLSASIQTFYLWKMVYIRSSVTVVSACPVASRNGLHLHGRSGTKGPLLYLTTHLPQ